MKKILFVLLCFFNIISTNADHIKGGQIYMDCFDSSLHIYKVNMVIHKAYLTAEVEPWIYFMKSDGSLFDTLKLDIISMYTAHDSILMQNCDSLYGATEPDSFYYNGFIQIDSIPLGGLTLTYQKCCGSFVLNCEPSGITLFLKIYSNTCNSTPRGQFNLFKMHNCLYEPFYKNLEFTDPDGDSLAYELIPMLFGAELSPTLAIEPPMMPDPFINVPFQAGFSLSNYIGGAFPLQIFPNGFLYGEAGVYGSFYVNLLIKEYRDGVLLTETNKVLFFYTMYCMHPYIANLNDTILCDATSTVLNPIITPTWAFAPHAYYWDFGDASSLLDTSTAATPVYTYPAPGSYTVMMVDGVGNECADTAYATVVVALSPTAQFASIAGCLGDTLTLLDASTPGSGAISTWQWSGTSIGTTTVQNPSLVFNTPAPILTLSVSNDAGCISTFTDTLQLLSPTPTSITPTATLCLGDTLTLQATGGGTYTWAANSQLPAGSSTATLTLQPTAPATYSVIITDANGCTATHTEQVYIDVVNYTVSLPTDTVLYQGAVLQVSASNGTAYQWLPGGQTTQQINIAPNADVQLIVQATDANGCLSSDTMLVRVVPSYFVLPTAFSPDGDHINDVYLPVYSGVERLESLKIFNRWGKKIFETNSSTQGWDGTYEGVAQPLGTYMAVCVTLSNLGTQLTTSGNVTLVK